MNENLNHFTDHAALFETEDQTSLKSLLIDFHTLLHYGTSGYCKKILKTWYTVEPGPVCSKFGMNDDSLCGHRITTGCVGLLQGWCGY